MLSCQTHALFHNNSDISGYPKSGISKCAIVVTELHQTRILTRDSHVMGSPVIVLAPDTLYHYKGQTHKHWDAEVVAKHDG